MAQVNLPMTLSAAYWDKQKAALAKAAKAPATKLPDELKQLGKLHMAVDWDDFGTDKLSDADDVKARIGDLDSAVKGAIKTLLAQAQTVETSATKFEAEAKKDKVFPKEVLTAAAAIIKAAKEYGSDVDAAVAAARKALTAKGQELAAADQKKSSAAADPNKLKIVKSRLLTAIAMIRKPQSPRPMRFIFVQGLKGGAINLALAYSVGTAQEKLLKGVLPGEEKFKIIKDKTAVVIWEKNAVTFVSDRLPSGVIKKVQLWVKKMLGLNLKLRVRKSTGEVEESEGEDLPEELLRADSPDADAGISAEDFAARLADLQADIKKAQAGPLAADVKAMLAKIMQLAKSGKHGEADAQLDDLEALMDEDLADETDESEGSEETVPQGGADAGREAFTKRLAALQPQIKQGLAGESAERIKQLVEGVSKLGKAGRYGDAGTMLDAIEALTKKGGGGASTGASTGGGTGGGTAKNAAQALDEWKTRRATAVGTLKSVATKVAAAKHASSAKAIIELQAVIKNLTEAPSTLQQVNELQRWLADDDVVTDVCELAEDIRTPLLGALTKLREAIAA